MLLKVIKSGSSGNCYLLDGDSECLVLEVGVPFKEVKKVLDFNISKIVGVCLSHEHLDHAKYAKQYLDAGIPILSSNETFDALNLSDNHNTKPVIPEKGYKLGNFKIIPFEACHDVKNLGFRISHPESGVTMFVTDSYFLEYSLKGVNNLMIEINYSDEMLEEAIVSGRTHPAMRPRLMQTHMALSTAIDLIKDSDLDAITNIILLHLSNENSNEAEFIRKIVQATGKQVYAASKGMEVDFSINPY